MKKSRLILIILSVLILLGCIGMTAFLLFFNYQNVQLFKQAQNNFLRGDEKSLLLAETQFLQIVQSDSDNETAFVMLGEIARKRKIYSEQVYYCYMAYRLNPLSSENKARYINSLCFARYFERLESFLAQEDSVCEKHLPILIYAAGRNGNISKYKQKILKCSKDGSLGEFAILLFDNTQLSAEEKLTALDKFDVENNAFLQQELYAAKAELHLSLKNIESAEDNLLKAYKLNGYAFASALGRFYVSCRNFDKALEVFERHLLVYHDQSVAVQCAEIYCLLNRIEKIEQLCKDYQADSGNRAMLCNYYFEALKAFSGNDIAGLKNFVAPLRGNVNTPLAAFMFFCVDIQYGKLHDVQESYNMLHGNGNYLNFREQADNMLLNFLKKSFAGKQNDQEKLVSLANQLYGRKKDAFAAKLILLDQKIRNSVNPVILKDAVKRFGNDHGVIKLAIEYYLASDFNEAEKLIGYYKQNFSARANDMLRYEILLNMKKRNYDKVSQLFQKNFLPELLSEYWTFASSTMRKSDLIFLSKDKLYEPYCKALLLLNSGKKQQAVDLLEKADANNNPVLLFFAAKILAENGCNNAALKKYGKIPDGSPMNVTVLLNMAEIYAETGDLDRALILSKRAYEQAPQMAESQLCYADKLHKKGKLSAVPDIIKLSSGSPLRRKMEKLWVAGMEQRIKECNFNTQQEKIRELCRQLQVIAPDNNTAAEYLKKLHQMPQ